ncbi:MAG: immunity 17 family protein [Tannerellaceae bacterium]|nr:immunity 17 family protein [Tannerellaceae bacterium]
MGTISLCASLFNADWFLNSRQAATFVHWLGRPGARIFLFPVRIGSDSMWHNRIFDLEIKYLSEVFILSSAG